MKRLWMISLLLVALSASAQITLVKKGKAKARIVLAEDNETNRQAAQLLNRFVGEMIAREAPEAPPSAPQSAPPSAPEGATNVSVLKSNEAPSGAVGGPPGLLGLPGLPVLPVLLGLPSSSANRPTVPRRMASRFSAKTRCCTSRQVAAREPSTGW